MGISAAELSGIYKASDEDANEEFPNQVEKAWTLYNNNHIVAVEGEYLVDFGHYPLGYYLSDVFSDNPNLATNGAQTLLTNSLQQLRTRRPWRWKITS